MEPRKSDRTISREISVLNISKFDYVTWVYHLRSGIDASDVKFHLTKSPISFVKESDGIQTLGDGITATIEVPRESFKLTSQPSSVDSFRSSSHIPLAQDSEYSIHCRVTPFLLFLV